MGILKTVSRFTFKSVKYLLVFLVAIFIIVIILPPIIVDIKDNMRKSDFAYKIEDIKPNTMVKATDIFGDINGVLYVGNFYSRHLEGSIDNCAYLGCSPKQIDKNNLDNEINIGEEHRRYLVFDSNKMHEVFYTVPLSKYVYEEKAISNFESKICMPIKKAYLYKDENKIILGEKR